MGDIDEIYQEAELSAHQIFSTADHNAYGGMFFATFSLHWCAVVRVEKGLQIGWPLLGAIAIGIVDPTAGRYLIGITSGLPA